MEESINELEDIIKFINTQYGFKANMSVQETIFIVDVFKNNRIVFSCATALEKDMVASKINNLKFLIENEWKLK